MQPMKIANWEQGFEVAQNRRIEGRLAWVAMPTRHDSRGYRKLIRSRGGVKSFACWVAMVQVAARCEVRGTLADDRGVALDADDLEAMTDIPASDFQSAIPILCSIGWLLCNTTSVLIDDSEHTTTTRQDSTQHNTTEQNMTVNSSTLYSTKNDAQSNWELIPRGRKIGLSKWRKAWIEVVIDEMLDFKMVMDSIVAYYESPDGKSDYFREPTTLLFDHVWDESPEAWQRNEKNEKNKVDESKFKHITEGN